MATDADVDVVLIAELPSNSWFEGIALRPDGIHGLATRLDEPELYTFNGAKPEEPLKLLHTFEEANGLVNLCSLIGAPDEFAVLSGVIDTATVIFEDFIVWRVKLDAKNPDAPPTISKIADLPNAGMAIGIMPASERTLLVADSIKNCIYTLDIPTGKTSVLIEDEGSMKAAKDSDFFGLNRLRLAAGYIWFTNSSKGTLCRFPVSTEDVAEDIGLKAVGPVEQVADGMTHADGLAVFPERNEAYMMTYLVGSLFRIEMDETTGKAKKTAIKEHLVTPTCVELASVDGKPKAYIVCMGQNEIGWVNHDEVNWSELAAQLNASCTVTVNEEVA